MDVARLSLRLLAAIAATLIAVGAGLVAGATDPAHAAHASPSGTHTTR